MSETPQAEQSPITTPKLVLFAAAIFTSAFLLFQVQPLVSKAILPWFGGSPGVWTTCLLFFQTVLFAGYAYAHLIVTRLSGRKQMIVHSLLLVSAIVLLKVIPSSDWKPAPADNPSVRILMLLLATVGLPYFLLASTGPLLQHWWSAASSGKSPYRLYAVSNAGSLLALLTFPVLFEPALDLNSLGYFWAVGFALYVALVTLCGIPLLKLTESEREVHEAARLPVKMSSQMVPWFLLAWVASSSLLAITNTLCQDVAVIPFLWVVPLSLYLLSFILCFDSERWYHRTLFSLTTGVLIAVLCWHEMFGGLESLLLQILLHLGILFGICMLCHGEVARMKPHPQHLTTFYLTLSAGGAAGGLFVAILAPAIFPDFWEFYICMLAGVICAAWVLFDARNWFAPERSAPLLAKAGACILLVMVGTLFAESIMNYQSSISLTRNFYGVLEVEIDEIDNATVMRHGKIVHGIQHRAVARMNEPTTYYSTRTGVGQTLHQLQSMQETVHVGLVGLGAGTLAAYGREGDEFRFYEINQAVIDQAQEHFTFLKASPANIEIVRGDARLSMEREEPQMFDLLVLDAFSGDAIPTHLLTREAFAVYQKHLASDGVIAVHVSNLYFNLRPVVDALADEFSMNSTTVIVPAVQEPIDPSSEWILLSPFDGDVLNESQLTNIVSPQRQRVLWTDSMSNLFHMLR